MFKIITFISNIIPLLVLAVRATELVSASEGLTSEEKKAMGVEAVTAFATAFGITIPESYMEWISKGIDVLVSVLNATIWRKE